MFGAVCPLQGKAAALIMPICNTAAMNHHLCEISSQVTADAHAVVILNGAGWHRSQARLGQPDGISRSRMAEMLEVDKAGPKFAVLNYSEEKVISLDYVYDPQMLRVQKSEQTGT